MRPALFGRIVLAHLLVLVFMFRSSADLTRPLVRSAAPSDLVSWKMASPSRAEPDLRRKIARTDSTTVIDPASQALPASVRHPTQRISMPSGAAPSRWQTLSFDRARLTGVSTFPPPERPQSSLTPKPVEPAFWLTRMPTAK